MKYLWVESGYKLKMVIIDRFKFLMLFKHYSFRFISKEGMHYFNDLNVLKSYLSAFSTEECL